MEILNSKYKYVLICVIVVLIGYAAFVLFKPKQIVLFYSDNCGHCQTFKPEWNLIKQQVPTVEYNCSGGDYKTCKSYGITAFPTIIIENGFKQKEYSGERTLGNILNFYEKL